MAHLGRAYPLPWYRPCNADAPYPYWLPDRYVFHLPLATGTLADYLSSKVYVSAPAVCLSTGILYTASEFWPLIQTEFFFDFVVGWVNLLPDPRTLYFRIQGTEHPLGLPPFTYTVVEQTDNESNVTPLHILEEPVNSLLPPGTYFPHGGYSMRAKLWH